MVAGSIHQHGLDKWWLATFLPDERAYMRSKYGASLDSGDTHFAASRPLAFLGNLASWFMKDGERTLAYRMLEHAETCYETKSSILDRHFYLQNCIEVYYRGRSDEESRLPDAILACKRQIELASQAAEAFRSEYPDDNELPTHAGYKQLCIILEVDQPDEAIGLAREAINAGWAGDWERRIERLSRRRVASTG